MKPDYWEEPLTEPAPSGCANCGPRPLTFPPDGRIAVGFGCAMLTRDGEPIWREDGQDWDDLMTGAEAEERAAEDPEHDWRISLYAPLSEAEYQRQDDGWVLIRRGQGFA